MIFGTHFLRFQEKFWERPEKILKKFREKKKIRRRDSNRMSKKGKMEFEEINEFNFHKRLIHDLGWSPDRFCHFITWKPQGMTIKKWYEKVGDFAIPDPGPSSSELEAAQEAYDEGDRDLINLYESIGVEFIDDIAYSKFKSGHHSGHHAGEKKSSSDSSEEIVLRGPRSTIPKRTVLPRRQVERATTRRTPTPKSREEKTTPPRRRVVTHSTRPIDWESQWAARMRD